MNLIHRAVWATAHLLAIGTSVPCVAQSEAPGAPNIIFIFTDDHAVSAISAYGSVINETPNIDRIASEGLRFDNVFCTNSICGPSRAVILTGRHSHINGVATNRESFDGSQETFPKLLRQVGYQTAIIGKWHLKTEPTGFDHYEVLLGQGPYYNPPLKTGEGVVMHEGYTTDVLTDRALEWLDQARSKKKPFMLMFQHKAPHRNWMPDPAHFELYDDVQIPEPATLFDNYEGRNSGAKTQEMSIARHMFGLYDLKLGGPFPEMTSQWEMTYLDRLTPEQRTAWDAFYGPRNEAFRKAYEAGEYSNEELVRFKYQRYIKDYLRVIASVDDNIGRLLDYLDEQGLAENTVLIYSSDQGFYLGEHGWYDKRWMYEESLRMPFILRWPAGIEPGQANSSLVQNIDFAPTFLELAGAKIPEGMQGESIVPLLDRKPTDWRNSIYYHYYESEGPHKVPKHFGVRTERHKLIHYYELDEWELFDLETDPDELQSIHADPAHAELRADLLTELKRLQILYGDTTPTKPLGSARQLDLRARASKLPFECVFDQETADANEHTGLDVHGKPIHAGAYVTPEELDGVILAHGGSSFGYSLSLRSGKPCFSIRNEGALLEIMGSEAVPLGEETHLIGSLDHRGYIHLYVNGKHAGAIQAELHTAAFAEGLTLGRDGGTPVAGEGGDKRLRGTLRRIRICTGVITVQEIEAWVAE